MLMFSNEVLHCVSSHCIFITGLNPLVRGTCVRYVSLHCIFITGLNPLVSGTRVIFPGLHRSVERLPCNCIRYVDYTVYRTVQLDCARFSCSDLLSLVSYVERTQKHRWRCSEVTLHCTDRTQCLQWVQAIREQLSLLSMSLTVFWATDLE